MSDFFEPPPPQPEVEAQEWQGPDWLGAPRGVLPCAVPLAEVIARTDQVAVGIAGLMAYSTGFEVKLVVVMTHGAARLINPFRFHEESFGDDEGELSPKFLRFGLQYADGRKSTNTASPRWPESDDEEPDSPTIVEQGGSGGEHEWRQDYWCWPLPPAGPLQFVCEWPAMEIPLTRFETDGQVILDAAARAQEIFPPQ